MAFKADFAFILSLNVLFSLQSESSNSLNGLPGYWLQSHLHKYLFLDSHQDLFMLWIFIIFIHQQTSDMKQKYKTKFYIIQNKTMAQNTIDTFLLKAYTSK